jgi:hypothetical protein
VVCGKVATLKTRAILASRDDQFEKLAIILEKRY